MQDETVSVYLGFSVKCSNLKLVRFCVKHLFNSYSFKKGKNKTVKISFGLILKIILSIWCNFLYFSL